MQPNPLLKRRDNGRPPGSFLRFCVYVRPPLPGLKGGQNFTKCRVERPLLGSEIAEAWDRYGSIARGGQRRWVAAKLTSLAAQLQKQARGGDVGGVTPHLVAAAPFDPTGMRG